MAAQSTDASLVITTYNPTITFNVAVGIGLGDIPLVAETGSGGSTLPATITGQVTTTGGLGATPVDISLWPTQDATSSVGGFQVPVTIPAFGTLSQPPTMRTTSTPTPSLPACPVSTDCYNYSLQLPAGHPLVGTFLDYYLPLTYATEGTGTVNYSLNAVTTNCLEAPAINSIAVTQGASTVVSKTLKLGGCGQSPWDY